MLHDLKSVLPLPQISCASDSLTSLTAKHYESGSIVRCIYLYIRKTRTLIGCLLLLTVRHALPRSVQGMVTADLYFVPITSKCGACNPLSSPLDAEHDSYRTFLEFSSLFVPAAKGQRKTSVSRKYSAIAPAKLSLVG